MSARWKGCAACAVAGSMVLAGLTGLAGTAAYAEGGGEVAPTSGPEFDAQAMALLALDGVEAVTVDGAGNVVLATTDPVEDLAEPAEEFVEEHRNVAVRVLDAPFTALAATDVVGGAGYVSLGEGSEDGGLCSVGFSAFSPTGAPAVVSAGHCTEDGTFTETVLTVPAGDTAGGGAADGADVDALAYLGTFGFSQYGGPGNTVGGTDDVSTDVSVIDVPGTDLTLLPAVTDWSTTADLSASTLPVTAVGTARVGADVVKSGRTTGLTQGPVEGFGWASVDGRLVYGFETLLQAGQGDSGGAVLQGSTAVGLVSGGGTVNGEPMMWAADLPTALARTGGYTVAVEIAAPVLTGPAAGSTVTFGEAITGTAGAGTTLAVQPSTGEAFEVPVVDGAWTFPAPTTAGAVTYTLTARSGFSASAPLVVDFDVRPATAVTSPADGERVVTTVQRVAGVGAAGETVALTGAVEATLEVAEDGTWEHDVDLTYGVHTVAVAQVSGTPTAPSASTFEVVPVAPEITSPADGDTFAEADAPTTVSGTGIDGATVGVDIGWGPLVLAEVVDGTWTAELPEALEARTHTIAAAQTINEARSDFSAQRAFTVAADEAAVVDDAYADDGSDGALAVTGASVAMMALLALVLTAAGGYTVVRTRRAAAAREATVA